MQTAGNATRLEQGAQTIAEPVILIADRRPGAATTGESAGKEMPGMRSQMNTLRSRAGLSSLGWSDKLADTAGLSIQEIASQGCAHSDLQRLLRQDRDTLVGHFAPALPGQGKEAIAQRISASYVVAEWAQGAEKYASTAGDCRLDSSCRSYGAIVSPKAAVVGCAHFTCETGSQVWLCRFGDK